MKEAHCNARCINTSRESRPLPSDTGNKLCGARKSPTSLDPPSEPRAPLRPAREPGQLSLYFGSDPGSPTQRQAWPYAPQGLGPPASRPRLRESCRTQDVNAAAVGVPDRAAQVPLSPGGVDASVCVIRTRPLWSLQWNYWYPGMPGYGGRVSIATGPQ